MSQTSITRRSIAKGMAWSAPAVIATSTIPAYSASMLTADNTSLILYTESHTYKDVTCSTSKPQGSYLSTLGTGNDPKVSVGWWNEDDAGGSGGTVDIGEMTVTYTFNYPIKVVDSLAGTTGANKKGNGS